MFESLGITETTLAVYRALLEHPRLAPTDIAEVMNLPAADLTGQLNLLRLHQLVVPRTWAAAPGEEYAIHPNRGFALLAERRHEEIERLQKDLRQDEITAQEITEQYNHILRERTVSETEILLGQERANQRVQEFMPTVSMWGMIPPSPEISTGNPEQSPDKAHLDHGIEMRFLYTESQFKLRIFTDYAHWARKNGAQVRVTPSLPMKLLIFDGESVVMGIDPDDTSVGAVVHHSKAVLRLAVAFYEHYWRHATDPFAGEPADPAEITPQEREFLNLLVQGATDEQAGRKLGVSLRTVRRMAAKLSEQAGASGRFELGVRAAQRGWVK